MRPMLSPFRITDQSSPSNIGGEPGADLNVALMPEPHVRPAKGNGQVAEPAHALA
jgi:hypothetical protein